MTTTKAIGILGGTFDPIHFGHTIPAQAVAQYLKLDKVILLPASIPPHKARPNINAKLRAEMVVLACQQSSIFECDTRELNRTGHSYTVDTIKELSALYPAQTLYFIMGMDSLLTFTSWKRYQEILSLCNIVVNTRPNYKLPALNKLPLSTQQLLKKHRASSLQQCVASKAGAIVFSQDLATSSLEQPPELNISSTEIRAKLKAKENCEALINSDVMEYITKHQLYR